MLKCTVCVCVCVCECVDVNGVCVGQFYIYNVSKCTGFVCLCEFNDCVFCVSAVILLWGLVQLCVYVCVCVCVCVCVRFPY